MSRPPPRPPPSGGVKIKSAKSIKPPDDELGAIKLKKVDESQKHYKTLYDMIVPNENIQGENHPTRTSSRICHVCSFKDENMEEEEEEEGESTQKSSRNQLLDFECGHFICESCFASHVDDYVFKKKKSFVRVPCTCIDRIHCSLFYPYDIVEKYLSEEGKKFVNHIKTTTIPQELPEDPCPRDFVFPLESFGYKFDEELRLRHITTGQPFYFINEKHYNAICDSVGQFIINNIFLKKFSLQEHFCDAKKYNNFFLSDSLMHLQDKVLMILHGAGKVVPGQWSRRLCTSDDLYLGTCLNYIDLAFKKGYDVAILNTNCTKVRKTLELSKDRFDFFKAKRDPRLGRNNELEVVENCENSVKHLTYVLDKYLKPRAYKHYFIVAHSAGGIHTQNLILESVINDDDDFLKKLVAIAFTDSFRTKAFTENERVRNIVCEKGVNWGTSSKPLDTILKEKSDLIWKVVSAGNTMHENTSSSCMYSVFKFFDEKFSDVKGSKK